MRTARTELPRDWVKRSEVRCAVRQFLVRGVGIPESEVTISRASGLDENRITAYGTVQLLRHLVLWLNFNNLLPQDVLPVAGIDEGTLQRRFTTVDYRGSVIGKTGTLPATDGGVSTLAGLCVYAGSGRPSLCDLQHEGKRKHIPEASGQSDQGLD